MDSNLMFFRAAEIGDDINRGKLLERETLHTFKKLKSSLNINTVVIPITAYSENAQSIEIDFQSEKTPSDFEIENLIDFAQNNGARVLLKPKIELLNGTNPAFIDFLDEGIDGEPTFVQWFKSYKKFILHFAKLAKVTGVSMFSVGAGLTKSEREENEWRNLISEVRGEYDGFLTYCAKNFCEEKVPFWDALDFISEDKTYIGESIAIAKAALKKLSLAYQRPYVFASKGKAEDTLLENENCCGIVLA